LLIPKFGLRVGDVAQHLDHHETEAGHLCGRG
jgi:hypothetical protein